MSAYAVSVLTDIYVSILILFISLYRKSQTEVLEISLNFIN